MFMFACSVFTKFMFSILFIMVTLLLPIGQTRKETRNVHIPYIDIALLYDQSGSMAVKSNMDHVLWKYMEEWIRNYFMGSDISETRFAVMGCGSDKPDGNVIPVLYFDGSSQVILNNPDKAQMVIDAQNYVRNRTSQRYYDNVAGCARSTLDTIFVEDKGDRPNATNVVFYISDCATHENTDSHKKYMAALLRESVFLFICTVDQLKRTDKYAENGKTNWKNMIEWVKNESLIFPFTTRENLVERLDTVLPSTNILVTDCELNGITETGCINQNGSCVNTVSPIIIEYPNPVQYGKPCPAVNITTCEPDECDCNRKINLISETCCEGEEILFRDVSRMPWCNATITNVNPNCTNSCTVVDQTVITVGVIIGVLIFIILLIIVFALVILRKKQANRKRISPSKPKKFDNPPSDEETGQGDESLKRKHIHKSEILIHCNENRDVDRYPEIFVHLPERLAE